MCWQCHFRTPSLLITPTLDANQSVSESQREHLFLISLVATSVWQAGRLSNTFACLLLSSCLVHLLIHLPQTLTHTCPSLLISDFFAVRAAKILPTNHPTNHSANQSTANSRPTKRRQLNHVRCSCVCLCELLAFLPHRRICCNQQSQQQQQQRHSCAALSPVSGAPVTSTLPSRHIAYCETGRQAKRNPGGYGVTVIVSDQHHHNTVTGAFSAAPSTSAELKEQTAVVLVVVPAATATSIDDAFSHHLCSGKLPLLWGEQETLNGIGRRQH